LLEIIRGIEGYDPIAEKSGKSGNESASLSVIHEVWESSQNAASNVLDGCTLKDLCDRQSQRQIATAIVLYIKINRTKADEKISTIILSQGSKCKNFDPRYHSF